MLWYWRQYLDRIRKNQNLIKFPIIFLSLFLCDIHSILKVHSKKPTIAYIIVDDIV